MPFQIFFQTLEIPTNKSCGDVCFWDFADADLYRLVMQSSLRLIAPIAYEVIIQIS